MVQIISGAGPLGTVVDVSELQFTPIWEELRNLDVSGAAVTTLDFNTLDLNADEQYKIIVITQGGSVNCNYKLFVNGDMTEANYAYQIQKIDSGSQSLAAGANPIIGEAWTAEGHFLEIDCVLSYLKFVARGFSYQGNAAMFSHNIVYKTADVANVTQIELVTSTAGQFKDGTTARLYRRKIFKV